MVAIAVLFAVYILIYSGYVFALISGFSKLSSFTPTNSAAKTSFSVIIPFRTEEKNLPVLLDSIASIDYSRDMFEIIFINDASEDFSENLINKWRMANGSIATTMIDNIRLSASPKKDAISRAIPIAKGDFVITTDADCELPVNWLRIFHDFIFLNDVEMIAGPVAYAGKNTFLHHFQRLDLLSLQGVTIGSFGMGRAFMCNGANFAYTKKLFHDINGFDGVDEIASGDDVLLLQKALRKFPEKVGYLKSREAIVKTKPADSWTELLNQRVRWASKAMSYDNLFAENLALVTFLANLFLVISVICAATEFFDWRVPLALFVLKLIPDWILLWKSNRFFKNSTYLFPLFSALVYPIFVSVVAFWALTGTYSWKGRRFRR